MGDRTRDAVRLEKLSAVAYSITTVSAREMLAQLVAGNRDAAAMAELAHGKMRKKRAHLVEALTGRFDDHHALLVGAMLHRLDHVEAALAELMRRSRARWRRGRIRWSCCRRSPASVRRRRR
jgi:hypothetical protein